MTTLRLLSLSRELRMNSLIALMHRTQMVGGFQSPRMLTNPSVEIVFTVHATAVKRGLE